MKGPANLKTVDELGEGNVLVVVEDVNSLKVTSSSVLELEAQKLASVGRRSTAKLNSQRRAEISYDGGKHNISGYVSYC